MTYGDYPDLSQVKKILIIKLRQLGDVLLTTPVFSALQAHLPKAKIDAYVYKEAAELLEDNPFIRQIISYDRNWKKGGLFQRCKKELMLWRQIRKEGYDLVINLTEGDRGSFAAYAAKAKIRVGFPPKGKWQKKLYTHVIKNCPGLRHTVERNLDAVRRIGIFPDPTQRELFLSAPKDEKKEPFILIHPTSRWLFKCWPTSHMRALSQELLKMGKKLIFTSGPDPKEQNMIREIIHGLDVINLSGKITLKELSSLIHQSELLICVDSLPFHMANALKTKVIALFGPTSDITWGPWQNPNAKVVAQNMSCRPCYQDGCGGSKVSDCLATLSVRQVLKEVIKMDGQQRLALLRQEAKS